MSNGEQGAESREKQAALKLLSAAAVRERCARIMAAAVAGKTPHFTWHEDKLDACADYVLGVMRKRFPDLNVPIHSRRRHFEAGGIDRWSELVAQRGLSGPEHAAERARIGIDLTIPSVLLDAGAGASWEYYDEAHHKGFSRSEGLGVASFDMFVNGAFAADKSDPLRSDASALMQIASGDVEHGFQVDAMNPLVGVEGRVNLLRRLGAAARVNANVFGTPARLGNLYDHLKSRAVDGKIPATLLLTAVRSLLDSGNRQWSAFITE